MKKVAILGSTGSIGINALNVIREMPGKLSVFGLAAHSNSALVARQAAEFAAKAVSMFEPKASDELKRRLDGRTRRLAPGVEGLCDMASHPDVDVVLTSLVGGVGFAPLLAAIRAGKIIALANKEPMVMAGAQFMREAARWGARIVPVDSEPSAIFQCVQGLSPDPRAVVPLKTIRRVFLTASGGAFAKYKGDLSNVTPEQALKHPTWKMGRKITIDCATLMNKGFELIEIMNLFGLKREQIEIVIHPQSIFHSGVEFSDGSVLAQMGVPDMKLPIQYAMTFPERAERVIEPLDLVKAGTLEFRAPDFSRSPCLELAREAAQKGGGMPAVLNAADEIAVSAFLGGRIKFTDIPRVVEKTMAAHQVSGGLPGFQEIVEIDAWARAKAEESCR
ncbi:MAG TPA: 1-deoxy-D-xylulose-5-phosphate reductoisomerase [Elusimicrobia bacterium]|nr:MAG: 1-deoxy-D-xylulose-5-phosphate reductoisomerase [Elusimicrobia bacterium GWA2_66_18]OGR71031.1 MAG: 1-deoxy-D-xylulose-5-phosphate reductoisomerase [Elusimicrobia bacterium GWC2_65_9]HAZ08106.1 1-deoxy-D-xylulose-5-phosphate reductoisomerase [Elusimicrobiota bacterium]